MFYKLYDFLSDLGGHLLVFLLVHTMKEGCILPDVIVAENEGEVHAMYGSEGWMAVAPSADGKRGLDATTLEELGVVLHGPKEK